MFKIAANIIFPFVIIFATYIQINGEFSPGGGFQAGAIFASMIVSYNLIFDKLLLSEKALMNLAIFGVLIYIGVGVFSILFGYNFLDYNFINIDYKIAQSIGIFIIELGVFLTVSCGLSMIYFAFLKEEDCNDN